MLYLIANAVENFKWVIAFIVNSLVLLFLFTLFLVLLLPQVLQEVNNYLEHLAVACFDGNSHKLARLSDLLNQLLDIFGRVDA
jgi:hypothetical protein